MRTILTIAAAFLLFAAIPSQSDARGHGQRGERRLGNVAKKLLHPLQTLKARRGR